LILIRGFFADSSNPKSGNPTVYVDFSDNNQAYSGNSQNGQIIQAQQIS
jgi:hypothetical protein